MAVPSWRQTVAFAGLGTLVAREPVSQVCVHSKMQVVSCLSRPLGHRDMRVSEVLVRPALSREAGLACRRASIAILNPAGAGGFRTLWCLTVCTDSVCAFQCTFILKEF